MSEKEHPQRPEQEIIPNATRLLLRRPDGTVLYLEGPKLNDLLLSINYTHRFMNNTGRLPFDLGDVNFQEVSPDKAIQLFKKPLQPSPNIALTKKPREE